MHSTAWVYSAIPTQFHQSASTPLGLQALTPRSFLPALPHSAPLGSPHKRHHCAVAGFTSVQAFTLRLRSAFPPRKPRLDARSARAICAIPMWQATSQPGLTLSHPERAGLILQSPGSRFRSGGIIVRTVPTLTTSGLTRVAPCEPYAIAGAWHFAPLGARSLHARASHPSGIAVSGTPHNGRILVAIARTVCEEPVLRFLPA